MMVRLDTNNFPRIDKVELPNLLIKSIAGRPQSDSQLCGIEIEQRNCGGEIYLASLLVRSALVPSLVSSEFQPILRMVR